MGRVIIVGAGPAGATLGRLLAAHRIEVVLLERQHDFAREFRGEILMPSGVDALRQMGLGATLEALPHAVADGVQVFHGPRQLLSFRFGDVFPPGARPWAFSQVALLEAIVADAARHPTFHLERGATVRDLVRDSGRVVGVEADTAAGPRTYRGDLVIGADGRSSVLRHRAGLDEVRQPQAFDIIWCRVPRPAFLGDTLWVQGFLGIDHIGLAIPAYDGRLQLAWVIRKGTFGELRRRGIDAWLEDLAHHVPPELGAHLRAHRRDVTAPFLLDVVSGRLERWTAPGLLLLGDAAHPMSPVGGQGVNIALRDVLVAASELVPALAGPTSVERIDAAAARVQAERLPEVVDVQRRQHDLAAVMLGERVWMRRLVIAALPWIARAGLVARFAPRLAAPILFGTRPVRLTPP